MRPVLYLGGLIATVTLLVLVDRSPSDVANQASLVVLLLGSAILGFAAPGKAWLTALAVGSCLAVAHASYVAAGSPVPYPMSPAGWAGPATLLLLLVPAALGAFAGAGIQAAIRRRRAST